ncbi:hypothetical protein L9F63_001825, partial [Diploptera punctata]
IRAALLVMIYISSVCTEDSEVCTRCNCYKKALIQSLYTVNCVNENLHYAFPDPGHWPDYSFESDTRMAVNFDWNMIKHLNKFPSIPGIVSLSLRYNHMTSLEEGAFMDLVNLKALDLSYNELTVEGIQADVFRGRYSSEHYEPLGIVILNLGNNNIHSLTAHSFEHLPNLKELRLDYNPLSVIDSTILTALESPVSLEILDLAYTGISDIPQGFVDLPSIRHKLKQLYLNGNKFTEVPQTLAALGDSLEKLNLNDNPIQELHEDSFRGLLMLREVNISAMSQLQRIGPSTFSHLKNLEILQCSYNTKLSEIDEEAFTYQQGGQIPLKQLHIMSNNLHYLSENLVPWESMTVIDVQNNPWRCDCNLEWFVTKLAPILENSSPDFLTQIHCSEPLQLSGMSILAFRDPDNVHLLCDSGLRTHGKHHFTRVYLSLLSVSIIALLSITLGFMAFYFIRQRTNRAVDFSVFKISNIRYVKMFNTRT